MPVEKNMYWTVKTVHAEQLCDIDIRPRVHGRFGDMVSLSRGSQTFEVPACDLADFIEALQGIRKEMGV